MSVQRAQVVICGAGIAGVSSAYFLAAREGVQQVWLLDGAPPLSLTSDQSTECYRNWWPGPGKGMVQLMNRSIELMEELADASSNAFQLNRRGYLYCNSDSGQVSSIIDEAQGISSLGAGPLRIHEGHSGRVGYRPAQDDDYRDQLCGADLLLGSELIQQFYPFLAQEVCTALHVRNAGWLSAQQLGMHLLSQARQHGVQFVNEQVSAVEATSGGHFLVTTANGRQIESDYFVDAAGPFVKPVAAIIGVDLPVFHELHLKVNFKDSAGVLPRNAPLVIDDNTQQLEWGEEERHELEADPHYRFLLEEMPSGVHARPEGGLHSQMILVLWEYDLNPVEPVWSLPADPFYAEIALRGLSRMIPGMQTYLGRFSKPVVDGGYYTKTRENRPLIGPLPVPGAFVIGALSGFGIMASCAAGELLAKLVCGRQLPDYAAAFSLQRYQEPAYLKMLEDWGSSGQL